MYPEFIPESAQPKPGAIVHAPQPSAAPGKFTQTLSWWNGLKPKQQYGAIASLAIASVLAIGVVPRLMSNSTAIIDPPQAQSADPEFFLEAGATSFEDMDAKTEALVSETQQAMLRQEAQRLLLEAQKQIAEAGYQCSGKRIQCALNQFERDAIAAYSLHASKRQWVEASAALTKIDTVNLARSGNQLAAEPAVKSAELALETRLQAREQIEAASAESIAADLIGESYEVDNRN